MNAGIRDISIISTSADTQGFQDLLGGGYQFGVDLQYDTQVSQNGLVQLLSIEKSLSVMNF